MQRRAEHWVQEDHLEGLGFRVEAVAGGAGTQPVAEVRRTRSSWSCSRVCFTRLICKAAALLSENRIQHPGLILRTASCHVAPQNCNNNYVPWEGWSPASNLSVLKVHSHQLRKLQVCGAWALGFGSLFPEVAHQMFAEDSAKVDAERMIAPGTGLRP